MHNATVVFITAIYGRYEKRLRQKVSHQTVKTDWICFTDNADIQLVSPWQIDRTPYHEYYFSAMDDGRMINTLKRSDHPFIIAKYYKQQFFLIPRLQSYDIVVWIDATIEIKWPKTSEWLHRKIVTENQYIIGWAHDARGGSLSLEAKISMGFDSNFTKYASSNWLGHPQPYQNVTQQYLDYIKDGYRDGFWNERRHLVNNSNPDFGVWCTCFVAFDNKNGLVRHFLNYWYLETLRHTTQDQISFSFVAQKLSLIPYTLPDKEVWGEASYVTQFYWKYSHGAR